LTAWSERLGAGIVLAVPRSLPPDPALAAALRRLREDRGMAQEALAFRSGISTGAIARIELGQASPAWVTVRAIATALDVTLRELADAMDHAERED
jgi:transcriptional regulator with XRE-family HTH domain